MTQHEITILRKIVTALRSSQQVSALALATGLLRAALREQSESRANDNGESAHVD